MTALGRWREVRDLRGRCVDLANQLHTAQARLRNANDIVTLQATEAEDLRHRLAIADTYIDSCRDANVDLLDRADQGRTLLEDIGVYVVMAHQMFKKFGNDCPGAECQVIQWMERTTDYLDDTKKADT